MKEKHIGNAHTYTRHTLGLSPAASDQAGLKTEYCIIIFLILVLTCL